MICLTFVIFVIFLVCVNNCICFLSNCFQNLLSIYLYYTIYLSALINICLDNEISIYIIIYL